MANSTDSRSYVPITKPIEAALLNTPRTPEFEAQIRALMTVAEAAEWYVECATTDAIGDLQFNYAFDELIVALANLKGNESQ